MTSLCWLYDCKQVIHYGLLRTTDVKLDDYFSGVLDILIENTRYGITSSTMMFRNNEIIISFQNISELFKIEIRITAAKIRLNMINSHTDDTLTKLNEDMVYFNSDLAVKIYKCIRCIKYLYTAVESSDNTELLLLGDKLELF
jgi:hypothetical protein